MKEPETQAGPAPMRRRVKILLIASLALNLMVAGLVVGAMVKFGGDRAGPPPRGDVMIWALEGEQRRAIGDAVREAQGGGRRAFRQQQRAALAEIVAVLKAEPFDAEALEAALASKSAYLTGVRKAAEAAFAAEIGKMSADERRAYAERLEKMRFKRRPKR